MADNLTTTTTVSTVPGGTVIATDDAGGVHYQMVKLVDGTLNGTDPIPGTSANGLDVDVTRLASGGSVDIGAVADAAVTTDTTGSLSGKLRGLVKWAFERMPASLGQKAKTASFPVVIASDQDALAVTLASTTITGSVAVDSELTTADVDTGAGTDTRAVVGLVYGASGGGTLVSTTNPLPVGDNGGSLTVDNGGTFVTQENGAALTALQLIDNIVLAEDAVHGSGDPGVQALAVRKDSGAAIAGTDGDYSPLQVDSSGNLRVNVAAGGAGDGAILDGVSSSIKATVLDFTNSNPLAVRLTDTNGDYVGAGAGTQYTEDAAAAADPVGTMVMAVRADSLAAVTSTDGDNIAARATNKGELYVKHVDALPAGTNNIGDVDVLTLPALPAGTNNIGDVDVLSIAAGDNNIGNVDIVTMPNVTLAAGTNTNEVVGDVAQDAAASGNPLLIGGRASAAAPTDMSADGDSVYIWTTLKGAVNVADAGGSLTVDNAALSVVGGGVEATALRVTVASDSTGVLSVDDNGSSLTVDGTITASNATGNVAHDAADSGNPVKIGGIAKESDGTDPGSVAEDDRVDARFDRNGRIYTNNAHPNHWTVIENHTSAQTNNQLKAAPGANLSFYITDIIISTDVATNVKLLEDEGGTPVTVAGPYYFAANGGIAMPFVTPKKLTANKSLGFTGGAAGNFTVEVHGYTAP